MAQPWTWVFQSNPTEWDLVRCLQEQPRLFWKVSHYKKDINPGDTVYMWQSSAQAMLLARCSVTSKPRLQPADPKYATYMKHRKYLEDTWRCRLVVEQVFSEPLDREELLEHPLLAEQLPIGGQAPARQGTNFSVPPDPSRLLAELTRNR